MYKSKDINMGSIKLKTITLRKNKLDI